MSIRSFYLFGLLSLIILLWQIPNIKKLSSYNIKWLIFYMLYIICCVFIDYESLGLSGYSNDILGEVIQEIIGLLILLPMVAYILFPTIYKVIDNWRVVKWIDLVIDKCYQNIKEHL